MIFVLIICFKDENSRPNSSKRDEKTGKFYPVLNGDEDAANVPVTLPDGSKGRTDELIVYAVPREEWSALWNISE